MCYLQLGISVSAGSCQQRAKYPSCAANLRAPQLHNHLPAPVPAPLWAVLAVRSCVCSQPQCQAPWLSWMRVGPGPGLRPGPAHGLWCSVRAAVQAEHPSPTHAHLGKATKTSVVCEGLGWAQNTLSSVCCAGFVRHIPAYR